MFGQIYQILISMLSVTTILWTGLGAILGIIVGAMPGLTATMTVALLLSITYGMGTANALAVLIGVHLGAIYGGSRSAILVGVPGTPSSAATILDGYPLAKKGKSMLASMMATVNSAAGGLIGVAILFIGAPILAEWALHVKVWEYFWLAIFGITISANLTTGNVVKGIISGLLGLLITTIGLDPIYGDIRFIMNMRGLLGGISLVPAMVGLFGFAQALEGLVSGNSEEPIAKSKGAKEKPLFILLLESFKSLKKYFSVTIISGVIGTIIGAIPGVGPDIAGWVSYDAAKRRSKNKEEFGHGSYEGLLASETANNAATSGVFIPLLTLGIPGCAVSAVILGGMRLHGLRPGPVFFIDQPEFIAYMIGLLILSNIFIIIWGTMITPILSQVVKIPFGVVMPIVIIFCVLGAYGLNYRMFDIGVMIFFGLLGFFMKRIKMHPAPMVLGIVLGKMGETNLRRGLIAEHSFKPFFTRPISLSIIFILIIVTFGPQLIKMIRGFKSRAS